MRGRGAGCVVCRINARGFSQIVTADNFYRTEGVRYLYLVSSLWNLDHSLHKGTYSTDITWLSGLTILEHLDMTLVNLSTIVHWLPVVNMLPTLKVLRLMSCQLKTCSNSLQLSNLTSIETLDLSGNDFHGPFPDEICNMTTIVELDLSFNNLVGMIPSNMKNLCNLETLSFSGNNMNGRIGRAHV